MGQQSRRTTTQRKVILEEIRKVRTHPTADEVYDLVRQRLPRVSLGTVYRNLDILSGEGQIRKIQGEGQRRYDGDVSDHLHLRCSRCGRVGDIHRPADIPPEVVQAAKATGFAVTGCRVEYVGLCGECREEGASSFAKASSYAKATEDRTEDKGRRAQGEE